MSTNTFMFQAPRDKMPRVGFWHRIVVMVPGDLNTAMQFAKGLPGYDPEITYSAIYCGTIQNQSFGPVLCAYMDVREAVKGSAAPDEGSEFAGNQFAGSAL